MKTKTRDRLIFAIAIMLVMFLPLIIFGGLKIRAYAEELPPDEVPEEVIEETLEDKPILSEEPTTIIKETVIDEQTALENFFNRYIIPIVGGTAGTIIIGLLAVLRPYIKQLGENKTLKTAYAAIKDKLNVTEKTAEELKEQIKNVDLNGILTSVTESVIGAVSGKVTDIVKAELDKKGVLDSRTLANVEVISAQLTSLLKAAAVTWGNVDGVPQLLSQSPTAAALERQTKAVEVLKTIVATKTNMQLADIQSIIDEALDLGITAEDIQAKIGEGYYD